MAIDPSIGCSLLDGVPVGRVLMKKLLHGSHTSANFWGEEFTCLKAQ